MTKKLPINTGCVGYIKRRKYDKQNTYEGT